MSNPTRNEVDDDVQIGDEISTQQSIQIDSGGGKMTRLRSVVWQHFYKKEVNGEQKAICKYYSKELGRNSDGTHNLLIHMDKCNIKRQNKMMKCKSALKIVQDDERNTRIETWSFDQEVIRKTIARAIIKHEYPLSIVEHEGFREILVSLNPLWKNITRNIIKKEIINLYKFEKAKNMSLLEGLQSKVAITTDIWMTDVQNQGYMVVTAQFIDDTWALRSQVLRFIRVQHPYTGRTLANLLMTCLVELNIERKQHWTTANRVFEAAVSLKKSVSDSGCSIM